MRWSISRLFDLSNLFGVNVLSHYLYSQKDMGLALRLVYKDRLEAIKHGT
jgi:hypothetical protein